MTIKRKDFQKAAAVIHEFHLKLSEDGECAELRDALNLALLHMQRYYRVLRSRLQTQDRSNGLLATSVRGLSPMTPFRDTPDKFQWRWVNLDNPRSLGTLPADIQRDAAVLPMVISAAKQGHNDMLMQIIDRDRKNIEETDSLGRSALMYAVHFGHLDCVQILLEHGIDVNAAANDGSTAVHVACHEGNQEALQILIEYSADLAQPDVHGRRPIHWACASKHTHCLQLLLENQVDVNVRDNDGLSPSMWACRLDHITHFELLSQVEQHITEQDGLERDNYGRTWMHWAVRRTEPLECLKTLLTEDTANLPDDFGRTVIHMAADMGSSAAASVVLEIAGKSALEQRDMDSRTPLILATIAGHGELVNYLLAQGADLASVDNTGATAWDYARGRQLHYCMLIIASYIRQRAKQDHIHENLEHALRDGADLSMENALRDGADLSMENALRDGADLSMENALRDGADLSMENALRDGADLSMDQLQINGEERPQTILYNGNHPVAPPQPPSTPRTPRAKSRTPGTPRAPLTPQTPATPRAPTTPRTTPRLFGVKRSTNAPLGSSSEEDNNNNVSERVSSGSSKRKKNEPQERDSMMSVMSIESVAERVDSVTSGDLSQHHSHPHGNPPHQQLHGEDNQEEDSEQDESVSMAGMDVSDLDDGESDEDAGAVTARQPPQKMARELQQHRQPQQATARPAQQQAARQTVVNGRGRPQQAVNRNPPPHAHQQMSQPHKSPPPQQNPPSQQNPPGQQAQLRGYSPTPPPRPSPRLQQHLPSPSSQHSHPHFTPSYQQPRPPPSPPVTARTNVEEQQDYTHEDYIEDDGEEEVPPHHRHSTMTPPQSPFAPPLDPRALPPAHLVPLPPPSPTRRKKKKKRKDRRESEDSPNNSEVSHSTPRQPQPVQRRYPPEGHQGSGMRPADGRQGSGQGLRGPQHLPQQGAPVKKNQHRSSPSSEHEIEEKFALDDQLRIKASGLQVTGMPSLPQPRGRPSPSPRLGSANKQKLPANLQHAHAPGYASQLESSQMRPMQLAGNTGAPHTHAPQPLHVTGPSLARGVVPPINQKQTKPAPSW